MTCAESGASKRPARIASRTMPVKDAATRRIFWLMPCLKGLGKFEPRFAKGRAGLPPSRGRQRVIRRYGALPDRPTARCPVRWDSCRGERQDGAHPRDEGSSEGPGSRPVQPAGRFPAELRHNSGRRHDPSRRPTGIGTSQVRRDGSSRARRRASPPAGADPDAVPAQSGFSFFLAAACASTAFTTPTGTGRPAWPGRPATGECLGCSRLEMLGRRHPGHPNGEACPCGRARRAGHPGGLP